MPENFHWYCMFCTKVFLPYSVLNDNEFKQTVVRKQVKFTHIAKPAISNTENFIKAINSESNITKYFTIKDLNSTFNDIGNPFSGSFIKDICTNLGIFGTPPPPPPI